MHRPRPQALLVDFYGTLAHGSAFTLERGIDVLVTSLREDGVDVEVAVFAAAYRASVRPYLKVMQGGIETHNTSWVADALRSLGRDAGAGDPRVVRAVRRYFEAYGAAIEPIAGADEALRGLAARLRMVLVSNFTDALPVRTALDRYGWTELFSGIVISADLGIRKPHPGIFQAGLDAAGCGAAEALFVGDDLEEDMGGARRAGIGTVHIRRALPAALRRLFPPPEEPVVPDWVIDTFAELPALLGEAPAPQD